MANSVRPTIVAMVLVVTYTQVAIPNAGMLWLGFPLGLAASAYFSGMGAFLTENFPTRMRGSGQGFAYNFGRGIGALNPTFVGLLSAVLVNQTAAEPETLGTAIAISLALGTITLLAGTLQLPGAAEGPGTTKPNAPNTSAKRAASGPR